MQILVDIVCLRDFVRYGMCAVCVHISEILVLILCMFLSATRLELASSSRQPIRATFKFTFSPIEFSLCNAATIIVKKKKPKTKIQNIETK